MNIFFLIILIVTLCSAIQGYRNGMVKSIISFISLIVMCIVVALIGNGVKSYFDGEFLNAIMAVLLLAVLGIAHHLLGVVFFSAKMITKLPIVHWLDKLLGMVVGILETVLIIWTIYTLTMMMNLGMVGQQILVYTEETPILVWLYQHNYLAYWLENLSTQITF